MNLRSTSKYLTGATALIALGATLALAQDTTRARPTSTKRIPISKEGGPASRAVRVDTVTVFKTDTVATTQTVTVHDTVKVTNTVTKVDTTKVIQPAPIILPGGFYVGVAAGGTAPAGALFNPNNTGPTGQFQLGWQGAENVLGVRGDVNFTRLEQDAGFANPSHPQLWNFNIDAKLQLPFAQHMFGTSHRFGIYAIGGYTHTMFRNLPMRINPAPGQAQFQPGVDSWTNENGWNAGGGASLSWGRTEIFAESRVLAFTATNAPMARQIPVMLGINWY
jgi:hypothetical protein